MGGPVDVLQPAPASTGPTGGPRPPRMLVAVAIAVAVAAVLPVVYLVFRARGAGVAGVGDILLSARTAGLLGRTVLLAAAVTATAVAVAVPVAWLTLRTDLPGRRTWFVLSALPLVFPSFVGGYAFVAALGPRGTAQSWLEPLGVDRLPSIYGFGGAWLVLSLFTYPLVLLPVRTALRGLDPSLEEAARSLGRSRRSVLFRVTLPQLRPAIVSGSLLVALYALSDFGAVSLLRFDSFTRAIYIAYRSSFDRTEAAVLGLVLVSLMVAVLFAESRTRRRAVYHATHRGTRRAPAIVRLGAWRWPAIAACSLLIAFALALPLGVIAYWLVNGLRAGADVSVAVNAALHSLEASLLGAVASVFCAWPVAFLAARYGGRAAAWTERAAYTGYALPGIVIALSLVFLATRSAPFLYQTLTLLTFAYVVHFLPQAVGPLRSSMGQIHPGLVEAARSLGASPREALRRVTLPLVRPGAMTGAAIVFLTVMKDLPITLLLAPTGFQTLATEVWDAASAASFANAAPPALGLVLLSCAPLAVLVVRERVS